jgi:hypothetical protein
MWTIFEIVALANDIPKSIDYFREKNILKPAVRCELCHEVMVMIKDKSRIDGCFMNCYACRKKQSIRHGSFLSKSKLSIRQMMLLFYLWSMKIGTQQTALMLGLSQTTIVDWNNMIREICSVKFANETNPHLGGPGHIVQIDESSIYKAKYNRGHALYTPTKWIFAIYDVDKKVGAIELVPDRSAATLLPIIEKYVLPGTEIHSDEWAAYRTIGQIPVCPPFIHKTVNHSLYYKDPLTGVHSNNVEAYWSAIKRRFKILNGTSRSLTPSYLDEHMYRERYGKSCAEVFDSILSDIGVYGK